jgi:hypothetical protein
MKLDRAKKYEGWGHVLFYNEAYSSAHAWVSEAKDVNKAAVMMVEEPIVQSWLDAGHIRPLRETKIVRVENARIRMRNGALQITGWDSFAEISKVADYANAKPVTLEFEVDA